MKYIINNTILPAPEDSFYYPFLYGTGDIEMELQCDININLDEELIFYNPISSFKINTNGHSCILNNYGIIFKDINSVNVSNITFNNFIGDGIQMNNVPNYSIRNCTFTGHVSNSNKTKASDEAISSVKGAGSLRGEIAYNKFINVFKGILCGTGDTGDDILDINQKVFIHHNYFKNFERRAPYCRYGKYFIYNNVFENWHFRDTQTFCIWVEDSAIAIIVSNAFLQENYNVFDGFPKRQFSWFTSRPWCMNQGVKEIFNGKSYITDNFKNKNWIKLEGTPFINECLNLPEYEVYSDEMVTKVKSL